VGSLGDTSIEEQIPDTDAEDASEDEEGGDSGGNKELTRDSRVSLRPIVVPAYAAREDRLGAGSDMQVLSLHAPYGTKLGAAFYDAEKRVLLVLEDTKDTVGWDLATLRGPLAHVNAEADDSHGAVGADSGGHELESAGSARRQGGGVL
jgi:hypothetical protein